MDEALAKKRPLSLAVPRDFVMHAKQDLRNACKECIRMSLGTGGDSQPRCGARILPATVGTLIGSYSRCSCHVVNALRASTIASKCGMNFRGDSCQRIANWENA